MKKQVITISREFGSGGRTIGRQLAETLGVPCYDRELIVELAKRSGFDPHYIQENGEYATAKSTFFFNLSLQASADGSLPIADQLYIMTCNLIRELAEKEPCVIVGRCADHALQEREDCMHAFIHADKEFRAHRIVELYGERKENPQKRLKEKDDKRRVYYRHYAGREWGAAENYHISLNSGKIGIDQCVSILAQLAK